MKLTGRIAEVSVGFLDGTPKLTLAINEKNELKAGYDELKDCEKLTVELKPYRKRRSLNANAYLWVLCGKLAEKLGCSKDEVYKRYIRNSGIYRTAEISENAAETVMKLWGAYGVGWLAEKVDAGENEGMILVNLYYGSSSYNTKQMARLLDSVVEDCREQGIQTMTPDELAQMKSLWKKEEIG